MKFAYAWSLLSMVCSCDDAAKRAPSAAPSAAATAAVSSTPPKAEITPEFEIDTVSPKVGFERALLQNPEGRGKLTQLLSDAKRWIEGKDVRLVVDRKTKVAWVAAYLEELGRLAPAKVTISVRVRSAT